MSPLLDSGAVILDPADIMGLLRTQAPLLRNSGLLLVWIRLNNVHPVRYDRLGTGFYENSDS